MSTKYMGFAGATVFALIYVTVIVYTYPNAWYVNEVKTRNAEIVYLEIGRIHDSTRMFFYAINSGDIQKAHEIIGYNDESISRINQRLILADIHDSAFRMIERYFYVFTRIHVSLQEGRLDEVTSDRAELDHLYDSMITLFGKTRRLSVSKES